LQNTSEQTLNGSVNMMLALGIQIQNSAAISWLHRASTISNTLFSNWCTQR